MHANATHVHENSTPANFLSKKNNPAGIIDMPIQVVVVCCKACSYYQYRRERLAKVLPVLCLQELCSKSGLYLTYFAGK
jgi:hypothetical protein